MKTCNKREQIAIYICPNGTCICQNSKRYLFKYKNVFVQIQKGICSKLMKSKRTAASLPKYDTEDDKRETVGKVKSWPRLRSWCEQEQLGQVQ